MGFIAPNLITLTGATTKNDPVIVRPSGIGGLTELTPSAGANWECVDETTKDDDTSYVETHATDMKFDLYATPNQTHTGTITSLKIYSYAKSHLNSPSIAAEYALIVSDDNGVTVNDSDIFDLTTEYALYTYVWFLNPRTGLAWTWGDMDNLQVGVEVSSPSIFNFPTNIIFRPDGDGTYQNLENWTTPTHYIDIDEVVSDGDTSIIECKFNSINTWNYDTYTMPSHTTETGAINSVTVWARCKATGGAYDICKTRTAVYIGGTFSAGDIYNLSRNYVDYSTTWTENPDSSATWTWDDIDNLEIGLGLYTNANGTPCRVTQVWCVINYDKAMINPEMRVTQVYAEINTTSSPTCSLPSPIEIEVNQQIETKGLNFWSGNREVYAQGRTSFKTSLSGLMWDGCTDGTSTCETIIACVRALGKTQNPVTIAGLRYADLNDEYNIISFGWQRISEQPNCYSWNLELELTDLM